MRPSEVKGAANRRSVRLSEVRDGDGKLTYKMCCICFQYIPVAELYVDPEGQKWDMCVTDGEKEDQ